MAFTRVAARVVAEPPKAALCRRSASADVVTSIVRSDCYRLERQLPGGIRTRWGMAPFTAHRIIRVKVNTVHFKCFSAILSACLGQGVTMARTVAVLPNGSRITDYISLGVLSRAPAILTPRPLVSVKSDSPS